MRERKIKELAIAMEALSRIQGSDEYFTRITRCLDDQLAMLEQETMKERYPDPIPTTDTDIDIPF